MQQMENPTVNVSVKKNVLKTYRVNGVKTVFLKNKTEFELELFNSFNSKVLCKVKLNGSYINGGGIVLRPAQRIFLERYLDNDRKFKFSIYEVNDNDPITETLIKENGDIEVEFYLETFVPNWQDTSFYYSSSPTIDWGTTNTNTACIEGFSSFASYDLTKETGTIEKGSKSKQKFNTCYDDFTSLAFHTEKLKILPDSQKIYSTEDIKHKKYCSDCGSKVKRKDNYCSKCGTKT